ncbi:MAG: glutamine synthetase [Actinobacteria bacterium]|nr:glutamine synthetase [Actinomycetota bacterium]
MDQPTTLSARDIPAFLEDNAITRVRVDGIQPDALPIGKVLHPRKFLSSLDGDFAVADFVYGTDRMGEPGFGFSADWRSRVVGDIYLRPDLATLRLDPAAAGLATCFADALDVNRNRVPVCGRGLVKHLTERLNGLGLTSKFAFEIEGHFFERSFGENRANGWTDMVPFGVDSHVAYLAQDHHRLDPVMTEICRRLDLLGVPWEAWNAEAAAGQFELNVSPDDPLSASDHVIRVRQVCKEVAHERGLSVTFMAKVSEDYGNGLHVHHSLLESDGLNTGEPVMYDPDGPDQISLIARQWLAGLMATLPGSTSFMAPNPNSFRRVVPFKAVPTHATWDIDNKSSAIRVLNGSASSARMEHRVGAGDLNPYFAAAIVLAGGIAGLEHELEPPPKFEFMAWGLPDTADSPARLPASVVAAAEALEADALLNDILGADLVTYWTGMRRFEWLSFNTGGGDGASDAPNAWEINRYFETL